MFLNCDIIVKRFELEPRLNVLFDTPSFFCKLLSVYSSVAVDLQHFFGTCSRRLVIPKCHFLGLSNNCHQRNQNKVSVLLCEKNVYYSKFEWLVWFVKVHMGWRTQKRDIGGHQQLGYFGSFGKDKVKMYTRVILKDGHSLNEKMQLL